MKKILLSVGVLALMSGCFVLDAAPKRRGGAKPGEVRGLDTAGSSDVFDRWKLEGHVGVLSDNAKFLSDVLQDVGKRTTIESFLYTYQVEGNEVVGSLLHVAACQRKKEAVRILLANDFDPRKPDSDGRTPLYRAMEAGRLDIARMLLSHDSALEQEFEALKSDKLLAVDCFFQNLALIVQDAFLMPEGDFYFSSLVKQRFNGAWRYVASRLKLTQRPKVSTLTDITESNCGQRREPKPSCSSERCCCCKKELK